MNEHLAHFKDCLICKRKFQTNNHQQKYCSHSCSLKAEGSRRKNSKEIQPYRIFERDGFKCHYCGKSPHLDNIILTIDHIIPLVLGGNDKDDNLITACSYCNSVKGDRLLSLEIIEFLKSR